MEKLMQQFMVFNCMDGTILNDKEKYYLNFIKTF